MYSLFTLILVDICGAERDFKVCNFITDFNTGVERTHV